MEPGLSLKFRQFAWVENETGINYPGYGGEWGNYSLSDDNNIRLKVSSKFVDRMDVVRPDSIIAMQERYTLRKSGEKKIGGNNLIFSVIDEQNHVKKFFKTILICDNMHFAVISLSGPAAENSKGDQIINDLLAGLHLDSPHEADLKEGFPVTPQIIDSLVPVIAERDIKLYKKLYQKDIDESQRSKLLTDIHEDLTKKMGGAFTYEKYYGYLDRIYKGDFPIGDWIELKFGGHVFPELHFFWHFQGFSRSEESGATELRIKQLIRKELHYPADATVELIDDINKERRNDTVYWALVAGTPVKKAVASIYAFQFRKVGDQWNIMHYSLPDTISLINDRGPSTEDLSFLQYATDNDSAANTRSNILVIKDHRSQRFFLGNAYSDSTNFISTSDPLTNQYDASYLVGEEGPHGVGFGRARYKKKIYDEFSNGAEEARKNIKPNLRIYSSGPETGDINNNGREDCYWYSISNGKLVDFKACEVSDRGLSPIATDAAMIRKKKDSYNLKYLLHVSTEAENKDEYPEADPLQVYDSEDTSSVFKTDSMNPKLTGLLINKPGGSAMNVFTSFVNCFRMAYTLNMYADVDFSKMNLKGVKSMTIMRNKFRIYSAEFYPDGRYKSLYYYDRNTAEPECNVSFEYNVEGKFAVAKVNRKGVRETLFDIYAHGDTLADVSGYPSLIYKSGGILLRQHWDEDNGDWGKTDTLGNSGSMFPTERSDKSAKYKRISPNTIEYDDAYTMTIDDRVVTYSFSEKIVLNDRGLIEAFDSKEGYNSNHSIFSYTYY